MAGEIIKERGMEIFNKSVEEPLENRWNWYRAEEFYENIIGEEKHEKVKNMLMLEEEFWKQFGKDIDSKNLTVSTLCFDNLALKEYSLI